MQKIFAVFLSLIICFGAINCANKTPTQNPTGSSESSQNSESWSEGSQNSSESSGGASDEGESSLPSDDGDSGNFTENEFIVGQNTIKYCLYAPKKLTDKASLTVYLHGGTAKGDDLSLVYSYGLPSYVKNQTVVFKNSYVLMPQLSSDKRGWETVSSTIAALIDELISDYDIDAGRVSLTGHSMGGTGAWSLALAYPEKFSRVAPLSGSVKTNAKNVDILKNLHIRAFVGSADEIVPPQSTITMIDELKAKSADAVVTVFDGAGHFDVPDLAYLGDDCLTDWLAFV